MTTSAQKCFNLVKLQPIRALGIEPKWRQTFGLVLKDFEMTASSNALVFISSFFESAPTILFFQTQESSPTR